MRALLSICAWLATLVVTGAGWAQATAPQPEPAQSGFGTTHPTVVSLEHLAGATVQRYAPDGGEASTTLNAGMFNQFGFPSPPAARLGLHHFLAPPVSLGLLLGYADQDLPGSTALAGLRVGAAFPISASMSVWARAGAHYFHSSSDFFGETTTTDVRPGAEVLLVLEPFEHFGFMVGGMVELGVLGTEERTVVDLTTGESETQERDFNHLEVGLTLGVLMDF
jgi:hypothetical protein